jgi:hypothetical protein
MSDKSRGFRTHFGDAVVPTPEVGGTWGGTKNGLDIGSGGKGTGGVLPEVTLVDVEGAPKQGTQISEGTGPIANKG